MSSIDKRADDSGIVEEFQSNLFSPVGIVGADGFYVFSWIKVDVLCNDNLKNWLVW